MGNPTNDQLFGLAKAQFNVKNAHPIAVESIIYTDDLNSVFSPPHHGPRNVPILAQSSDSEIDNSTDSLYTHFPIVKSGIYYVYLSSIMEGVTVSNFYYKTPNGVECIPAEVFDLPAGSSEPFISAFKTSTSVPFDAGHPVPVAIQFELQNELPGTDLEYIVVGAQ